ncbi:hypothetical protein M2390_002942 [Mycetocola sp. BIGb0189]|uniref:hypothetical protein n=1 Tax=Mycetocola sp. BIGb0189 TaxID=2940604 RepID=UPI00216821CA|nr:hypothetical protein [Mycetocola sp. BIGb0189]MCS4277733.1 hypothetical protein [Mycetocola sp. BIGb0189]
MSERLCARGCARDAMHGLLICWRCVDRVKAALDGAPDLVAQLGILIDPRRAQVYNEQVVSRPLLVNGQAPMSVSMIDARDAIAAALVKWAKHYGDPREYLYYSNGVPSTATPERSADVLRGAAEWIITACDLGNQDDTLGLCRDLLSNPDDPTAWTVERAKHTYMPDERPTVVKGEGCPGCGLLTIRRTPVGEHGEDPAFECLGCHWTPPSDEYERFRSLFDDGVRR